MADKIILSPLKEEDIEPLFKWINDHDLVIYNAPYKPVSREDHLAWFDKIRKDKFVKIFGIRIKESDTLIGSCQLKNIDNVSKNAELQIRIGETQEHGKGLGTEAVRALLDFGFNELKLHKIYLHVFTNNERAIHVYKKVGFKEEGTRREQAFIDGKYLDEMVMGILANEYEGSK